MNTKRNKGIIGIILIAIMVASIFAVFVPAAVVSQEPAAGFSIDKDTSPDPAQAYYIGDQINYTIELRNTGAYSCSVDIWDILPDGTRRDYPGSRDFAADSPARWWNFSTVVAADWIDGGDRFTNIARVNGTDENPSIPGGDKINLSVEKTSMALFAPPKFEFEASPACCLNMKFEGSADVPIKNFTWYFGDGNTESGVGPLPTTTSHVYTTCGDKTVKLSGYSNKDVYNETKHTVHVDCGPNAVATATPSCFDVGGTDITFSANSSTKDTLPIKAWKWEFDDGSPDSSDKWVTKNVSAPLNATLTVSVGLDDGTLCCVDTAIVKVSQCSECGLRIYGTFGKGPGYHKAMDPVSRLPPENKPYSDSTAPFDPQHDQAPRKDHITFNPAIMDHNVDYSELDYHTCAGSDVQTPKEKVFKRMWYEKEWFKDHNQNGVWDVVIEYENGTIVKDENGRELTMDLRVWNAMEQWEKEENGWRIREWNEQGEHNADIYGPAVNQEFTYMFLDASTMPIMIGNGSKVMIPMAHDASNPYRGLNSFDADGDGDCDPVRVESEETLGIDIDGDGTKEPMDGGGGALSGNESVVLVLGNTGLNKGDKIQFFDHVVTLKDVQVAGNLSWTIFDVCDNEGGGSQSCTENVVMNPGDVTTYYRGTSGSTAERPTFYLKLKSADGVDNTAIVEVGRMFGQTYANIGGTNPYWSQKAFMVDEVFYNVVAIKAQVDNCIKYITFRQKLPKLPIKLYGKHLEVWTPGESPLPEMPPFNMDHNICVDVSDTWTRPYEQKDKIGLSRAMPPLVIDYISEDIEERYKGELKEIYKERRFKDENGQQEREFWTLEWFRTLPWQYTELRLPKDDMYLVTLSWVARNSEITIWDSDPDEPVDNHRIERVKFWYQDCTGPIYIDRETSSIRLYGTFGEGPGYHKAMDPVSRLPPENKPYRNPTAPFDPTPRQRKETPKNDFMTFNPAIMDHNQGYPELDYYACAGYDVQIPKEKVFKRMWYENEWFKDSKTNGVWDVVIEYEINGTIVKNPDGSDMSMTLGQWNGIPQWEKEENGWIIREWNEKDQYNADIYGPAINQEFTYMVTDDETMPIMVGAGSKVLIPMAHDVSNLYRGLNSFDADGDGVRDAVSVESEQTVGVDIDDDGFLEPMDGDGSDFLSGDETVVLTLKNKYMYKGGTIQFFDHVIELRDVQETGASGKAVFNVCSNEDSSPGGCGLETLNIGDVKRFYRGKAATGGESATFYLKLVSADAVDNTAIVEIGRMFGQTYANIGELNTYWNQKAFMVDQVFYNVVAIKAQPDNCIKYITFRQKLPKMPIKLYGIHLEVWEENELLPEMSPFNMDHEILIDVQPSWTRPYSQQDKIGPKEPRGPLAITYVEEDVEERFKGELKEIYAEIGGKGGETEETELWYLEWFHTQPDHYTAFVMPQDQLYLMTLGWLAPEAEITVWDGNPKEPMANYIRERVNFWYDPTDNTDIYVNKVRAAPDEPTIAEYYDMPRHGGNGNGSIDMPELVNGILDYLHDDWPFGVEGLFDKGNLLDYIAAYIEQEGS